MTDASTPGSGTRWDGLVAELVALRQRDGDTTYAEIARRVSERRVAQGQSEHAARVARSSVYDCFRTGRARMNLPLVREIAFALGATDADVDRWLEAPASPAPAPAPAPVLTPAPVREHDATAHPGHVLAVLIGCVALNLMGRVVVDSLQLPVYLDMAGTAIAAIAIGPWRGASVGLATNVLGVVGSGVVSIPFALVNVAGALVWGYGVRRLDLGRTLPRFFSLNLLVALTCSVVAVPILMAYGGSVKTGEDPLTATFLALTHTLGAAVSLSNVLTSVADKLISGFVALVVVSALPRALRSGSRLPLPDPAV